MAKNDPQQQLPARHEVRRAEQQARGHEPDLGLERAAKEGLLGDAAHQRQQPALGERERPERSGQRARQLLAEPRALRELVREQHHDGRCEQPGAEASAAATPRTRACAGGGHASGRPASAAQANASPSSTP